MTATFPVKSLLISCSWPNAAEKVRREMVWSSIALMLPIMWPSLALSAVPIGADQRSYCPIEEQERESAFYLVFYARSAPFPGHAYVVWAEENAIVGICSARGYGQYPSDGKKMNFKVLFGEVPGEIRSESHSSRSSSLFAARVDYDKYEASKRLIDKWTLNGKYKLLESDCVSFVAEVAKLFGLRVPDREVGTMTPAAFLEKFIVLNSGGG